MARLIFFLTITALLFPWASAHAEPRLVEIFCRALVEAEQNGPGVIELDWIALAKEMETLSPAAPAAPAVPTLTPAIADCAALYSPQFEEAEFILGGKRLLEVEIRRAKTASLTPVIESRAMIEDPLMGTVLLSAEEIPAAASLPALQTRHESYRAQWGTFLAKLKGWLKTSRTSAQVVQSPVEIR